MTNKHAPSSSIDPVIPQFTARMPLDSCRRACPSAAVVMVRVVETLPLLGNVSCVGLNVHEVSAGKPEQPKLLTVPESPLMLVTRIVMFKDWPAVTEP